MLKRLCAASVVVFFVAGCSSQAQSSPEAKYQRVNTAAHQCAEDVKNNTIELTAKGQSARTWWTTAHYVVSGSDGTMQNRTVEYRTSTAVDNGEPGSAWKKCMQHEDALVPELKFPA
jgi:PBP1b-binding outer membrane lipoprotein LpoB